MNVQKRMLLMCISGELMQTGCESSKYGCCRDKITAAPGPMFLGCPERCGCNKRGSYGSNCDPVTRQCRCKPGIGGIKCNRCEPGFWGLHKILEGNEGCVACNCNKFGSVRTDCEQTTAKCVCKPGITGLKCDKCPQGTILGPEGCTHASIAYPINGSCDDIVCLYGAVCVEHGTKAQCACDIICSNDNSLQMLCGSDGNIYINECQLKLASCRYQKELSIAHIGPC
ncbi:agrin-like protein [Leptotrombidium deliense]|uniref:Agrin-like protein n=1 Tax=Leptotrombidium deliense TaxID=299467 RepID=A0A443SNU6_9ACAR|nr:agrin-like protein [Leptotrombidium deliense]